MDGKFENDLSAVYPNELLSFARSLKHLGLSEIAWPWKEAKKVIYFLNERNYVILGGDVFANINGDLNFTYDSWYTNRDESETWDELVEESKIRAISYIDMYHTKNGEGFFYSIIASKEK